jgi:hypothetical protein
MKLKGQERTSTGQQREMRRGRLIVNRSFGLNPRPSAPSYIWSKLGGVTNVGESALNTMAISDFSLSQH